MFTGKICTSVIVSLAVLGSSAGTMRAAAATTVYDSNGFESFSDGGLPTQNGGQGVVANWFDFGAGTGGSSTATVFTDAGLAASGNKAVRIDRDGDDGALGLTGFGVPLPTAPQERFVFIEFDLNAIDINGDSAFGPAFGIELFTTGNNQVGGVGIDAGDGSLWRYNSETEVLFPIGGLQRGVYQDWKITVDLVTEKYSVAVAGNTLATFDFYNAPPFDFGFGDRLIDVSIVTFATDGNFADVEGIAYIDNYVVTTSQVPEPTSMMALLVAGGTLLARRRR
ncbi:MAG: PEP-CTERM sorting domain-containing protein [Planctomycetota bacterium]